MKVPVFEKMHIVREVNELRKLLAHRNDERWGAFWLWEEFEDPAWGLFIDGDKAVLSDDFGPLLPEEAEDPFEETTEFMLENNVLHSFPTTAIISTPDALNQFVARYTSIAQKRS